MAALLVLLVEVAIALWVRDRWVRPHGGDAFAVVLVYCGVRVLTGWRWPVALGAALGIAVAVELSQLAGLAGLLGFVRGSAGEVVLGSGFDLLDFVAYAAGGLAVAAVEVCRPVRHPRESGDPAPAAGDGSPLSRG